jgi:hypothetical protein
MSLRETLYSEPSSDFLWKTCEDEHVPDEKIYDVSRIAGYVLMGFIHPEDMASELKEELNLAPQTANIIADAVNKRVFGPLRADLDKIYSPIHPLEGGVKVLQDISPSGGPKIISQAGSDRLNMSLAPSPGNQPPKPGVPPQAPPPVAPKSPSPMPAPTPITFQAPQPKPAPAPLSAPGWSRTTSSQPVVQLNQISTPPPKPTTFGMPSAPSAPQHAPSSMPSSISGAMGEFERRALQTAAEKGIGVPPDSPLPSRSSMWSSSSGSATPPAPKPSSAAAMPAGPAPMMLHEDAAFKPAQSADFHLKLPPESFDMTRNAGTDFGGPKSAVVEFGKIASSPLAPKPPSGPLSTPRMVHYTEYKSPSPEMPVKPAPSMSPLAPPLPPSSSPSQDKVIFKNYSQSEALKPTVKPFAPPPTPPKPPAPSPMMPPKPPAPPQPPQK